MRRKGEKPVVKSWPPYGADHPVSRAIATGDGWFGAWTRQAATPLVKLSKASGIDIDHLLAIDGGAHVTRAEIGALASAWRAEVEDVIASLPNPAVLVE